MGELVIETTGLTKRYGSLVAVDSFDLEVEKGKVFGLLGPNGSGKTTSILMLLGLTEPSAGQVRVLGAATLKRQGACGLSPDQIGFYDGLAARENLLYIAKLNGLPRAEAYPRLNERHTDALQALLDRSPQARQDYADAFSPYRTLMYTPGKRQADKRQTLADNAELRHDLARRSRCFSRRIHALWRPSSSSCARNRRQLHKRAFPQYPAHLKDFVYL